MNSIQIITGQYSAADTAQRALIDALWGSSAARYFELYFHRFNVIHELGHAIMIYNQPDRPHPAREEQIVNNFAAAFWRHYGEHDSLHTLTRIVERALARLPAPSQEGYLEYAEKNWGKQDFMTFEHYGWFQFSSAKHALSSDIGLAQALTHMSAFPVTPPNISSLSITASENMAQSVVSEALRVLRAWGVTLPSEIPVVLCSDLNCHMLAVNDYNKIRQELLDRL